MGGSCRAARETAHDGLPHVLGGIDGRHLSVALDAVDCLNQEVAVAGVVTSPSASRARIGLHVNPHHSVEVAGDGGYHLIDLSGGGLASAGEHVDVGDESSSTSVVEVVDDVAIDSTIGAVSSDDGEVVATVLHALIGGGREELTDIHTQGAEGRYD